MHSALIQEARDWASLRADFRWPTPATYNIAHEVCDRWAATEPDRPALIHPQLSGPPRTYSFAELSRLSNKLANVFQGDGVGAHDRVAVLLPQVPETLLTHLATYKLGGIIVPLFTLFGADGLRYRLENAAVKAVVTDAANLEKILSIAPELPDLEQIYCVEGSTGARDFWGCMLAARSQFKPVITTPDTPALLVYTSGTTGPPKGTLHGHRVLLGHLPGVETHHDFFPKPGDCMWTPADWAWMGGLMDALMPALNHGVPVVAHRMGKFDADEAFDLMARHQVRNAFLPPTALKFMRQTNVPVGVSLRSVGSGGEALGAELLDWGRNALGLTINEFYGSTECNLVVGNSASVFEPKPGSTGRATPGKDVAIIDPSGAVLPDGKTGEIAVRRGDPAMFLNYWNEPEKTADKFAGDWLRMGDEGYMDGDGHVFFSARTDDVIMSAGYRIGPTEIEECLSGHPDVAMAAAIGFPDEDRGEVVKAFVVLRAGASFGDSLVEDLKARVRDRVSPHVAPRIVEPIDALPMTATGKIMRRELKDR